MTEWARRMEYHLRMERAAQRGRELALALRCSAEDSGGARCTADARPEHEHRYRKEDLPEIES